MLAISCCWETDWQLYISLMNINVETEFEIINVFDLGSIFLHLRDCGGKVEVPLVKVIEELHITPCFPPWLVVMARWKMDRVGIKGIFKCLTI